MCGYAIEMLWKVLTCGKPCIHVNGVLLQFIGTWIDCHFGGFHEVVQFWVFYCGIFSGLSSLLSGNFVLP